MRSWCRGVVFTLTLLLTACQSNSSLETVSGAPVRLHGQWLLVAYWADWCDDCVKEIPRLNRFVSHAPAEKVTLVGVSFDAKSPTEVLQLSNRLGMNYPQLKTDPAQRFGLPHVDVLPTMFVVNPRGQVTAEWRGPEIASGLSAMEKQWQP